jgi:pimeloyl-ACP methyl ester carboxylesterase
MSETDSDWIQAAGNKPALLASRAKGKGQTLVWAHTLMGSMDQENIMGVFGWNDITDIARVVRYDTRGHGRSESSADPKDYTWPQLAADMWQVANYYTSNNEPVFIGGASMGCATALHAACQHPERVKGLVLALPPTAWAGRKKTARTYNGFASAVDFTRGMPLKILKFLPPASKAGLKKRMVRVTGRLMANANPKGISAAMRGAAMSDLPPLEELAQLTMPALILAWPDDPVHPLTTATSLANALPNAQLHVSTNDEEPENWSQFVRRFVEVKEQAWADSFHD